MTMISNQIHRLLTVLIRYYVVIIIIIVIVIRYNIVYIIFILIVFIAVIVFICRRYYRPGVTHSLVMSLLLNG